MDGRDSTKAKTQGTVATRPHSKAVRPRGLALWKKLGFAMVATLVPLVLFELTLRVVAPQLTWTKLPRGVRWMNKGLPPNQKLRTYGPEFGELSIRTNSNGIIDHVDHSIDKPAGLVRILLLGDSFTEGYGCEYTKTFGYQAERSLQAQFGSSSIEIIKAGLRGSCTSDEVEAFQDKWVAYNPDVVVIGVVLNDIFDNPAPVGSSEGIGRKKSARPNAARRWLASLTGRSHTVALFRRLMMTSDTLFVSCFLPNRSDVQFLERSLSPEAERQYEHTLSHLVQLSDACKAIEAELHVLLIAQRMQVVLTKKPVEELDPYLMSRRLSDELDTLQIPTLDTLPALADLPVASTYYTFDGHLNSVGHGIVARELLVHLLTRAKPVTQLVSTSHILAADAP